MLFDTSCSKSQMKSCRKMPSRGLPSAVSQTFLSIAHHPTDFKKSGHHLFADLAYVASLLVWRGALGCFGRAASSSTVTSSASGFSRVYAADDGDDDAAAVGRRPSSLSSSASSSALSVEPSVPTMRAAYDRRRTRRKQELLFVPTL